MLSSKSMEVYDFIVDFVKENVYSPSVREIGEGVGLSSSASVYNHLKKLKQDGMIETNFAQSRTIKLVGYTITKLPEKGTSGGKK